MKHYVSLAQGTQSKKSLIAEAFIQRVKESCFRQGRVDVVTVINKA